MTSSISRRLVLWLSVPLMLVALCGALVHYFNHIAPAVINNDRRLKSAASAVLAHVRLKEGRLLVDDHVRSGTPLPPTDTVLYAVRDAQGHFLAGDPSVPTMSLDAAVNQQFKAIRIDERTVRGLTTRLDTPVGTVLLTVASPGMRNEPEARYGLLSTLLWDFVQLDATLSLVWVGVRLGLRPVKRLQAEIDARSPSDLRRIDEASVPSELGPVVVTLNRLFTMLRSTTQSQQQFIANTAHQLRTPITGLQAQLDLLLAEPAARPVQPRLLTLQEGIRQLAHSSNQLLALARADPVLNVAVKNQRVDLNSIVREVVARFIDRALQSNLDLGVDLTSDAIWLAADPALLDDLLSNLVDNALKYTPAGGSVTVTAGSRAREPYLTVEDTGPGIPEDARLRVLQRFYRQPNSPGHGSGLGLAIVDDIARLYGGRVLISDTDTATGTLVRVSFAASDPR